MNLDIFLIVLLLMIGISTLTFLFYRKKIFDWFKNHKKLGAALVTILVAAPSGALLYLGDQPIDGDNPFNNTEKLGWEYLDNDSVIHAWNTKNDYYFNASNGVQFSNHYQEYWTRNVLMLGYFNGGNWNLVYRIDELNGFNKQFNGETNEYMNLTLWKDLSYGNYEFRVTIRYYLGVNDSDLTIIPYIKNLGIEIPYILGFGWELKDIKIDNTYENDQIRINSTNYRLNQILDESYTNLTKQYHDYNPDNNTWHNYTVPDSIFYLDNLRNASNNNSVNKILYLSWNHTLDYKVTV